MGWLSEGEQEGRKEMGGLAIPCLRDNDVVEGGVAFAEAGEADLDDHYIARVAVEMR